MQIGTADGKHTRIGQPSYRLPFSLLFFFLLLFCYLLCAMVLRSSAAAASDFRSSEEAASTTSRAQLTLLLLQRLCIPHTSPALPELVRTPEPKRSGESGVFLSVFCFVYVRCFGRANCALTVSLATLSGLRF